MAARGLAPRRTPARRGVARHSSTAYSATGAATGTDLGGGLRPAPNRSVVHTGCRSLRANLPPRCSTSCVSSSRVGIADRGGHREPVQLAFHQRVGAALRQGVLGGDHQVGAGERPGLAVDGDLLFLHGLEQGRLGAGRGAVELVDQDHVGEDRPGPELPGAGVRCEDRHARHVGGQEIGVPLDARQLGPERDGQRPGQHGLADAGDVFDEQMAPAQGGHRGGGERLAGARAGPGPGWRRGAGPAPWRRRGRRQAARPARRPPGAAD